MLHYNKKNYKQEISPIVTCARFCKPKGLAREFSNSRIFILNNVTTRDNRLDLAKGLVVTFVIYTHAHPFDISLEADSDFRLKLLAFLIKQFYWQVILIVVPTFLLVAFYITFNKLEKYGTPYLWKRMKHLLKISAFWIGVQFAAYYVLVAILGEPYTFELPYSLLRAFWLGGPNLPIVQGSVFYYLIVLMALTLLAYLFHAADQLNMKWFAPLVGGLIVLASLVFLEWRNVDGKGLQYWRIECFLAYVPLAYYLRGRTKEQFKLLAPIFFVLYVIFSVQDVLIRQDGWGIGVYSRVSLIFGSAAFFCWLLSKNEDFKIAKAFSFLSVYTLGLISVHKIWQAFLFILIAPLGLSKYLYPFNLETLLIAALVTILSLVSVYLLGMTRLRFAVA